MCSFNRCQKFVAFDIEYADVACKFLLRLSQKLSRLYMVRISKMNGLLSGNILGIDSNQ